MVTLHTEASGVCFYLCCYSILNVALICSTPCPLPAGVKKKKEEDEGLFFPPLKS